ncbi:MAG: hypothetical protein ACK5EK_03985 [Flavobacteriia bacterium]
MRIKSPNEPFNDLNMFLLTDLSETGYRKIKEDRDGLVEKIKQYQAFVDEFDLALPFLESLFDPKISFSKQNNHYIAQAFIPFNQERIRITARIDDEMYKGKDDPRLIEKGGKLIKEKIRSQFPDHFRDEESKG